MNNILEAANLIRDADALLIGAGAGMGVDSGLPDFRGDQGFWKAYPPFQKLGLNFYDLADPVWFDRDPRRAWGFYGHRYNLYRETQPHEGFSFLKRFADNCQHGSFVFTSNVDGHFQRAGFADNQVVECHGSINVLQCAAPCCDDIWAEGLSVQVDESSFLAEEPLPTCSHCGSVARPNVLMFGDGSWLPHRTSEQMRRYRMWLDRVDGGAKLVAIELGAGTAVPTVRYECERRTRGPNQYLVRVNPREYQAGSGSISIKGSALATLGAMAKRIKP